MGFPNAFFGTGPGNGDEDPQAQRDMDALNRNRLQMTVATSTFVGIAIVGMFCSCLWFACCRNSSSKTRKKTRTWASPEAGLQDNPYSYEGYMETQGYLQMSNNTDGVAPYMNNPLYHPSTVQNEDNGLPNAFDFSDQLGKNVGGRAQLSTLFGGPMESCPKDVPPSYTALFFAASDPSTRLGQRPASSGTDDRDKDAASSASRMTSIHPIHLKVTSTAQQQLMRELQDKEHERKYALEEDEDYVDRHDPSLAPPVSLMSVESDSEKAETEEQPAKMSTDVSTVTGGETGKEKPPPYNPGYNRGYSRF